MFPWENLRKDYALNVFRVEPNLLSGYSVAFSREGVKGTVNQLYGLYINIGETLYWVSPLWAIKHFS